MKKSPLTQCMKEMRNGQTQEQLAMELNVSRESVSKYERGHVKVPADISQSLMAKTQNPWFAIAIRNEYTKTGPIRLNGPNFDGHRSAIREKTIEEVKEVLGTLEEFSFAKPLQNISEWERPNVELLAEHIAEAITALEHTLAVLCEEAGLSYNEVWNRHYIELQAKGYVQ
ncbi:helix-turn-helix domain-containing protein [Planomicrobium sp. MB-3u-38]|uniref:helix-turn-helix domain-containing protein n=1 Tax=Planomicrobium sp. MB-3u-38 TaxID=2058318 RepID=UPI000C7A1A69|nr:helix-turn-helix domain-containing protein [Planomicrobium sp. MB-3u-38]PKH09825.1 XRE family transcriptional regulator [Planomicrobium sp. MB-3u-38]